MKNIDFYRVVLQHSPREDIEVEKDSENNIVLTCGKAIIKLDIENTSALVRFLNDAQFFGR